MNVFLLLLHRFTAEMNVFARFLDLFRLQVYFQLLIHIEKQDKKKNKTNLFVRI